MLVSDLRTSIRPIWQNRLFSEHGKDIYAATYQENVLMNIQWSYQILTNLVQYFFCKLSFSSNLSKNENDFAYHQKNNYFWQNILKFFHKSFFESRMFYWMINITNLAFDCQKSIKSPRFFVITKGRILVHIIGRY